MGLSWWRLRSALWSVARGFVRAADRRKSNLTATEVKRLGVSNGGSEADIIFVSLQGIELTLLRLLGLSCSWFWIQTSVRLAKRYKSRSLNFIDFKKVTGERSIRKNRNPEMYRVILLVLDPRKCEYFKDYSLDFQQAYMTTYLASWKACRY